MRALLRLRPSPAMVVACAALLVALSGTSWATVAQVIPGKNTVGTPQLKNNAVAAAKVKNGAITNAKLANNAVTAAKIANGTIALADLSARARAPGSAGPAGPAGPPGPAGAAGASATKLWAVVAASGSISRSSGTTSGGRLGAGSYEVIFNQDVTNCAFVGTVGEPTTLATSGYASVARRTGNVNGVNVQTRSTAGALADRSFHLAVLC